MSSASTPPFAKRAAPVLAYHTRSAAPVGLHVERRPREWVIELHPDTLADEAKHVAVWATWGSPAFMTVALLLIRSSDLVSAGPPAAAVAAALFLPWIVIFLCLLAVSLFLRKTVRIEVLPAVVCWTVTGYRLHYETVCPRSQIVAIEHRFHGVRLKRRDRRRGDWIAFGSRAEQRQIYLLLGEALGLGRNAGRMQNDECRMQNGRRNSRRTSRS